jgi:hypothetical protein
MTDEEEFSACSQLKWTREGDAWILLYRRRRMGRVVPDKNHPGMWRSIKVDGILSDTANLSWSKDNVMAQAIREVAWNATNDPQKCPVNRGSHRVKSSPVRFSEKAYARDTEWTSPRKMLDYYMDNRTASRHVRSASTWPPLRARCERV